MATHGTQDGDARPFISQDGDRPDVSYDLEQLRTAIIIGIGIARREENAARDAQDIAEDVVHMATVSELRAHDV